MADLKGTKSDGIDNSEMGLIADEETNSLQTEKREYDDRGSTGSESETPVFKESSFEQSDLSEFEAKQSYVSFSDMVFRTFEEKSFLESFVPMLSKLIAPIVESSVNAAIASMKDTVVTPMLEANDRLCKSVESQSRLISEQKTLIDSNTRKSTQLENDSKTTT